MRILKMILAFDFICIVVIFCLDKLTCAAKADDTSYEDYVLSTDNTQPENIGPIANIDDETNSEKLAYINAHSELYGEKLVDVANRYNEAIDFVYSYPTEIEKSHDDTITEALDLNKVPKLYQWDKRWGYMDYSGGLLGYTGCGPTSLSMVLMYLTHDTSLTPAKVAAYATENGYSCEGSGSYWTLMSDGCEHFNVHSNELPLNEGTIIDALEKGHPIICIMGPGEFTDNGHFIVIRDYVDGKYEINDCFSPSRSSRLWTYEEFYDQILNMWEFY